ncbi:MAG: T9SS type A sorting domain-containing protein [Flavobacteriales bacterium]
MVNGLGQVVSTYENNDFVNGTTYDVSNLESGVYYITITEGSKIATKKLVIE